MCTTQSCKIVLVGPMRVGKSSVGAALSSRLRVPRRSLDGLRNSLYPKFGYDEDHARQLFRAKGFAALYQYWKPFEVAAVVEVLSEKGNAVIDFGAGHSVYEDQAQLLEVERALMPIRNVILLLPTEDPARSAAILRARAGPLVSGGIDFVEYFLTHSANRRLAKHVVLTEGMSVMQTTQVILDRIDDRCRAELERQ